MRNVAIAMTGAHWLLVDRDAERAAWQPPEVARWAGRTFTGYRRADGRWEAAYEGQKRITVPDDLQRELDARPEAKAFFAALSSQNRYAILYRLQDAKRPETRARRLEKFVAMLEAGETIYPS